MASSSSSNPVEYVELNDLLAEVKMEEIEVTARDGTTRTTTRIADKCRICNAKAFGLNYSVVSCNACKMFFRRVIVDNMEYSCHRYGQCYDNIENVTERPDCKFCRYEKCLRVGMRPSEHSKAKTARLPIALINQEDLLVSLIGPLLYLDSQREYHFQNIYTNIDPSMTEILSRPVKGFSGPIFGLEKDIPLDQWSFFSILTTVEFLGNLDIMFELELSDKVILVENFAMKSSFLSCCFWCMQNKYDRLVNPNGMDVYPDSVLQIPMFTLEFLNGIRKRLIAKLIELSITSEEYILINIILFCNSALSGLSPRAQHITSIQQKRYCSVLFKYCLQKYQGNGPARLNEIISIGHILSSVFQDVQSLVTIFQLCVPTTKHYKVIQQCFPDNPL